MLRGIDVSTHQNFVDWEKVKTQVDFAILRAGYGKNNVDEKFIPNADGCRNQQIPIGLYWFSYAYTTDMAKQEALYCIQQAQKYSIKYPIAYDFEYDSANYAQKNGVVVTKDLVMQMTSIFCNEIKAAGYIPAVYTNKDYATRFFDTEEIKRMGAEIWYAYYNKTNDRSDVSIWQYSQAGVIDGISGAVDMNYSYKDFAQEPTVVGWNLIEGRWQYRHVDGGYTKLDWEKIDGKWYYFDKDGWMITGWLQEGSNWFYLKSDGDMAENECLQIQSAEHGTERYSFGTDGHMQMTNDRGALV